LATDAPRSVWLLEDLNGRGQTRTRAGNHAEHLREIAFATSRDFLGTAAREVTRSLPSGTSKKNPARGARHSIATAA